MGLTASGLYTYLCDALKRFVAILVFVAFLLQGAGNAVVLGLFLYKRDTIARTLCVNRFAPVKTCMGKCYLKKKLAEQSKKDEQSRENTVRECIWFCEWHEWQLPAPMFCYLSEGDKGPIADSALCSNYKHRVFQPPRIV